MSPIFDTFAPARGTRAAEMRSWLGLARLIGAPVPQPCPNEAPPVVLVPGFLAGDLSMGVLSRRLRRAGLRTFPSEIGANLGCSETMVERLTARLDQLVAAEGRPAALVGHSRGGMITNLVARRRPELVTHLVVLAAPVTGTLSVAGHVRAQLELLFRLHRLGIGSALAEECVVGACGEHIAAELGSPFPATLAYTSVYSRRDAIVDWHTCLDPVAEQVEVGCAHTGMAFDARVAAIVAARLRGSSGPSRNHPELQGSRA